MVSPKCNDWHPCHRRRGHKETPRGGHVKMEAETGVTQLPSEGSQDLPEVGFSPRDASGRMVLLDP